MNRPRLVSFIAVLLMGLIFALPAGAQFWQKKEYTKWSATECKELLSKSPWANEYKVARAVIEGIGASALGGDPSVEGRVTPHVTYRVQFISAKPIRQAMARLEQLDPKYKKLGPDEQKAFDERSQKFIDTDFSGQVVIQLSYTTINAYSLPLARFWQTQPQDDLRKRFILITAVGRLEPVQVLYASGGQGGGGEFQLIYPRTVNGVALVNPDFKKLGLEFPHPHVPELSNVLPGERAFLPFNVKRMIVNGEVLY